MNHERYQWVVILFDHDYGIERVDTIWEGNQFDDAIRRIDQLYNSGYKAKMTSRLKSDITDLTL